MRHIKLKFQTVSAVYGGNRELPIGRFRFLFALSLINCLLLLLLSTYTFKSYLPPPPPNQKKPKTCARYWHQYIWVLFFLYMFCLNNDEWQLLVASSTHKFADNILCLIYSCTRISMYFRYDFQSLLYENAVIQCFSWC